MSLKQLVKTLTKSKPDAPGRVGLRAVSTSAFSPAHVGCTCRQLELRRASGCPPSSAPTGLPSVEALRGRRGKVAGLS